jgi:hypothetical protein
MQISRALLVYDVKMNQLGRKNLAVRFDLDQARGFPIIARKSGGRVRLYSRPGNDFTRRFPLIVEALARLRSRSCIIITRMVVQKMQAVVQKNAS